MRQRTPNTLTHPVFGKVRWQDQYGWWIAQVRDSQGEWLAVIIDPGDGDRVAAIEPAANLFRKALRSERRVLRDAVRQELLELYNDTWRQGDEPKLSAAALIGQLQLTYLALEPGSDIPVTLSYDAGEMFGGHSVDVEVDEQLEVIGTDLVG